MLRWSKCIGCVILFLFASSSAWAQLRTFVIQSNSYVRVPDIASELEMQWNWDADLGVMHLKKNSLEITFWTQCSQVLVDGTLLVLSRPLKEWKGGVFVPEDFMGQLGGYLSHLQEKTAQAVPAFPLPSVRPKIILDPGHGGKDTGAIGVRGIQEKNLVLPIALELRKMLIGAGYEVFMTRSDDTFYTLEERCRMSNEKHADLFISIHANASGNPNARGPEVYYLSDDMDDFGRAQRVSSSLSLPFEHDIATGLCYNLQNTRTALWDIMGDEYRRDSSTLAMSIVQQLRAMTHMPSRGIKSARFHVIKNTMLPAILIETGFVTNSSDVLILKNQPALVAKGIFLGIEKYFEHYPFLKKVY